MATFIGPWELLIILGIGVVFLGGIVGLGVLIVLLCRKKDE